jgi:hypothetical protein
MNKLPALWLTMLCMAPLAWSATDDIPTDGSVVPDPQSTVYTPSVSADGPAPQALDAGLTEQGILSSDGKLDLGKADPNVPFKVTYPSFGPGHKVNVRWAGPTSYVTPFQTTAATSPLTFYVPKATVAAALGSSATVTYTVEIPGATVMTSEALTVNVVMEKLSAPVASLAENGKLDVGKAPLQVPFLVAFPSLAAGEKVTLNWQGTTPYKTAAQTTTSTAAPLVFYVPREIVAKDLGNPATLTYTVEIAGAPIQTSEPLTIQILFNTSPPPRFPLPIGFESAKDMNTLYAERPDRCSNDTPAFYCSGIILRGVADGTFDPWDPSPSAVRLGAQSFSYVRSDANMKQTFVNSGYILSTPLKALAENKPVHYLCVYPYNAGTSGMTPLGKGCNSAATTQQPPDADLSTCSSKNAATVDQWLAYTKTNAQCSLSVKDPTQFMTLLGVRAASPGNTSHNELLIESWAQSIPSLLPLQGFFYTAQAGLAAARSFQNKFRIRTGRWLPVVRLDLTQSTPFAYDHGDQAILP